MLDKILHSELGVSCIRKGEAENRRLAYVGMTRARDATIIAVPSKNPAADAWMTAFNCDCLLPTGEVVTLPNGQEIPTAANELTVKLDPLDPPLFAPRWLTAREPAKASKKESYSPSQLPPKENATIRETVEFGERIRLNGDDMTMIGSGLHAVIAAELVNPERESMLIRAKLILEGYGFSSYISASDAVDAARRFHNWIKERFEPSLILSEHPIMHVQDDRRTARGWIDVLLETKDGWIIIDHKSSPRPKSGWPKEVVNYSGQLGANRAALEAAGGTVRSTWIHFPVSGGAVLTSI